MSETMNHPITAAAFAQFLAEKKLMAARCTSCGSFTLPPRAICPQCRGGQAAESSMEWVEVSGQGSLAAFTVIYIAPSFMIDQGYGRDRPYISGIVDLPEGVRISARILGLDPADPQAIHIGTPLVVDFIEHGDGDGRKTYLAFRPPASVTGP